MIVIKSKFKSMKHFIIQYYFLFIMKLYNFITGTKINYLTAPEDIINYGLRYRLQTFCHLIPSFILSIILTVRILPLVSVKIEKQLQSNSGIMWLYAISSLLLVSFLLGYLIEKYLELTNSNYKILKRSI